MHSANTTECARCPVEGSSSCQPSRELLVGQAAVSLCLQAALEAPTGRGSHQELRAGSGACPGHPAASAPQVLTAGAKEPQLAHPILNPSLLPAGLRPLSQGERASSGHWRCRVRASGQRPRPGPRLSVPVLGSSDLTSLSTAGLRRALCAQGDFQLALCEPFPQVQVPPEPCRCRGARGWHPGPRAGQGLRVAVTAQPAGVRWRSAPKALGLSLS